MCEPGSLAALFASGSAASTAAGATAAASTAAGAATAATGAATAASSAASIGSTLQTIGAIAGGTGMLAQGIIGNQTARAQISALEAQKKTEAQIASVEAGRTAREYRRAMRRQTTELAARGIQLDSPTAELLGQTAAQEMSFAQQSVLQNASARRAEMTAAQQGLRSQATSSLLKGTFGAASGLLTASPDLWPELYA